MSAVEKESLMQKPWLVWGCTGGRVVRLALAGPQSHPDVEDLNRIIPLTEQEKSQIAKVLEVFRMGITPYYASLMDPDDPSCPIRRQAIPHYGNLFQ